MKYIHINKDGIGKLFLFKNEFNFSHNYYRTKDAGSTFLTIAWNRGKTQRIIIDEIEYEFNANAILPLMLNQSFKFQHPENIIGWQFNREFYCIVNHDEEVGCVGYLFYGPSPTMFLYPDKNFLEMMEALLKIFEEEFTSNDIIKSEMLRMLLVRLIIQLTRVAKKQYIQNPKISDDKFNLFRKFNLLVETHFRKQHQVQFYAGLLNKSPKTISNTFSLYSKTTPQQIIHDKIVAESKRLFYYTDKTVKEIADELGFEDAAHFSKFFKNITGQNPSHFKRIIK